MEKQHTPDKQKPVEKRHMTAPAPIKKEEEKTEERSEVKKEIEAKVQEIKEEKSGEKKSGDKKEEKKDKKKEIVKKEKAIVNGRDLPISKKHSMAICDFIRYKEPEKMIVELELVTRLKKPIPMRGEIPHRKGEIMSGRYPVNACKVFINLLKTLNANSSVNGIENPVITKAVPNDASRPFKRGGSARFKRTNVYLEASELKNSDSAQKREVSDTREKKENVQKENKVENKQKNKENKKAEEKK